MKLFTSFALLLFFLLSPAVKSQFSDSREDDSFDSSSLEKRTRFYGRQFDDQEEEKIQPDPDRDQNDLKKEENKSNEENESNDPKPNIFIYLPYRPSRPSTTTTPVPDATTTAPNARRPQSPVNFMFGTASRQENVSDPKASINRSYDESPPLRNSKWQPVPSDSRHYIQTQPLLFQDSPGPRVHQIRIIDSPPAPLPQAAPPVQFTLIRSPPQLPPPPQQPVTLNVVQAPPVHHPPQQSQPVTLNLVQSPPLHAPPPPPPPQQVILVRDQPRVYAPPQAAPAIHVLSSPPAVQTVHVQHAPPPLVVHSPVVHHSPPVIHTTRIVHSAPVRPHCAPPPLYAPPQRAVFFAPPPPPPLYFQRHHTFFAPPQPQRTRTVYTQMQFVPQQTHVVTTTQFSPATRTTIIEADHASAYSMERPRFAAPPADFVAAPPRILQPARPIYAAPPVMMAAPMAPQQQPAPRPRPSEPVPVMPMPEPESEEMEYYPSIKEKLVAKFLEKEKRKKKGKIIRYMKAKYLIRKLKG